MIFISKVDFINTRANKSFGKLNQANVFIQLAMDFKMEYSTAQIDSRLTEIQQELMCLVRLNTSVYDEEY